MTQINLSLNGADEANRYLLTVLERGGNMPLLMAGIGEHMVASVQDNFESSTAPDGTPWAANSPVTFATMLGKNHHRKDGRINRRGENRVMSKRPLIQSHSLMGSIQYQATGLSVTVGTNMVYGAIMHFGGSKSAYPHLWGDIPARPYLGVKDMDKQVIIQMAGAYLSNPL